MNPWAILIALAALAASAAGGWHAHTVADKADERDRLAAAIVNIQADQQESRQISANLQAALAGLRPQFTTIRNEVQREIVEKPVYRDLGCALPDGGRLRLDAAIDAANRAGRLDATLSRPAEAGRESSR